MTTNKEQRRFMYGVHRSDGTIIKAPEGWHIIPDGGAIPHVHREYIEDYVSNRGIWAQPRYCHSTMTPSTAQVWGGTRAYAAPNEKINTE